MENENLVTEEVVTENVETPTEEVNEAVENMPKTFTEEEVNQIIGKKIARNNAKWEKRLERELTPHRELADVLRAGTGTGNVGELTQMFSEHYRNRGVEIPKNNGYSAKDIEILANAEANEVINGDYEDVLEEANRLKGLGSRMSAKEKAIYSRLEEHLQNTETENELAKIGVTKEEYESKEFREFSKKFTKDTPITEIYNIYASTKPKKDYKIMGSVKNETTHLNNTVKEYYSPEEARKFTKADFDKSPELFKAVQKSMQKWK